MCRVTSILVTEGQTTLVVLVHCGSIAEVLSRTHLQSQVKKIIKQNAGQSTHRPTETDETN